eukprot:TRINITY_DN9828_c0_g1_i1.p3 TRINITY_DN9828_c0_g1~~TRINITY_DN9828_c0_g1_i1.p3  ORF type:complete len:118 (+),score=12.37 TRINITY_DN9828_c0_g1_i1:1116-1469(+)
MMLLSCRLYAQMPGDEGAAIEQIWKAQELFPMARRTCSRSSIPYMLTINGLHTGDCARLRVSLEDDTAAQMNKPRGECDHQFLNKDQATWMSLAALLTECCVALGQHLACVQSSLCY